MHLCKINGHFNCYFTQDFSEIRLASILLSRSAKKARKLCVPFAESDTKAATPRRCIPISLEPLTSGTVAKLTNLLCKSVPTELSSQTDAPPVYVARSRKMFSDVSHLRKTLRLNHNIHETKDTLQRR